MSSSVLKTHVHPHSHEFEKHTRRMLDLLTGMKNEEEQIRHGGGARAIDAQHKKGRLALELLDLDLDQRPGGRVAAQLYESVRKTYDHQTDPRYAAARLWVDAIIDPAHTREALIWALEAAALNPDVREFKTGVLQT